MTEALNSIAPGERVLVTGGTGSLGRALALRLLARGAQVRLFSRDEKKQYDMAKEFPDCEFRLGDIRDPAAVRDAIRDIDAVIHGASLKYVNIGELQPVEYVSTNVAGTINLLDALLAGSDVRCCVGISSDKACQPVNTYGMTKAILEKLTLEANRRQGRSGQTVFTVARYGNVIGTRGSVVPFWRERMAQGLPLPLTNPDMTRFFFTMDEAIELVNQALALPAGLVVSKRMNACTVLDLANAMRGDSELAIIGERPGEKMHEMLLSDMEMAKCRRDGDIFVLDPDAVPVAGATAYSSDIAPRLTLEQIASLLEKSEL